MMQRFFMVLFMMIFLCSGFLIADEAVAVIEGKNGHKVEGEVRFKQLENGVLVTVDIRGMSPGEHGVHIHQYGDMRSDDGKSLGPHYNPENHSHGLPPQKKRHAGSFGNLKADELGYIRTQFIDDTISVASDWHPIIGRSIVFHANNDKGTQPAGDAGYRMAAGVIGLSPSE